MSRLAFLDSLRGWAATYVVLYHTALIPSPALQVPAWAAAIVLSGGTGVTLFFVVSAFSLCHAARPGEEHGRQLAAFAVRRFFRIAPLFYIVLAASVVRDLWLFSASHNYTMIAANAVFIFNLWPGQETGIAWASWTIGVEVLFYAVFPFLAIRAKTVAAAAMLAAALLFAAAAWPEVLRWTTLPQATIDSQSKYGLLRHMPIFAFGILTYRVFERFIESNDLSWQLGGTLLLGAAYFYFLLIHGMLSAAPFHDIFYWQGMIYGTAILGLAIYPSGLLVNRLTLYMGRVSYSLYLLHPFVVYSMIPVYRLIQRQDVLPTVSFGACAALTLAATLALSTISYVLIEVPGMRMGRQFAARLVTTSTGLSSQPTDASQSGRNRPASRI